MLRTASLLLLVAVCGWTLRADDVGLVRVGENWRYLAGKGEASSPPTAWRQVGFDDSAWSIGPSGFGNATIGIATEFRDMPFNYSSLFLRKKFLLSDPEAVKWLVLRLDYDDGFVAYLNGAEIVRRGLSGRAGEPVPFNAPAEFHGAGAAEEIEVSAFTNLLVKGENILAIQAHNSSLDGFSFSVIPEFLANFQRGPFVQDASSNQIRVIWKTPRPSDTKVEFGTNAALDHVLFDTNAVITHAPTLANLLPDTIYSYRVSSSSDGQTAVSPIQTFRTLKASGSLCFAVFGDSGWGSMEQYQIARVIQSANPDLVLHTGDIIYTSFTAALADTRCLSVYAPHMKSTPYFFAIGNHDLLGGTQHLLEAFYLPTNSVSMAAHAEAGTSPEHYYSFDHGDAHFVVLFIPYLSQYKLSVGDAQYNWLTNDLATTRKSWKILAYHVPMNSSSGHRFDDINYNQVYDRLEIRDVLLPVASRYGVQLMVAGHEHGYERFNPTNGVHSITTAGGGVPAYPFTALDAADAFFWARFNCLKVTINGDTLEAQALGVDGQVFDSMSIQRALPEAKLYQALWHTPVIETAPPDDGQGNILGQTFDFQGPAIPALTGKFSNLGRAFVNNDQTNLYVGFDRVMIYGNNNIFLFIESPRLAGVTNLAGIGNGILDPAGQGADGLDFLSNLSFTNFTPSIGCILGDEFGDGQFRSFLRTNLALNIGQGVFKLDEEISDVLGVRLQQYDRSPQIGGAIGEENANFIEVAIPLSELGALRPGDIIKIGAVVGGESFSVTGGQGTRLLDDGCLGSRLISSAQGPAALEGTRVQLALDPQGDEDGDGVPNEREMILGLDPWNLDSDRDGLPDGWEIAHQLDPLSAASKDGSYGDPDQDSFPNALELLAGTDPLDSSSVLRLELKSLDIQKSSLSWSAVVGKRYELEYSDYPFTNFVGIPGTNFPRVATSRVENFENELPSMSTPQSGRLYRVRLVK